MFIWTRIYVTLYECSQYIVSCCLCWGPLIGKWMSWIVFSGIKVFNGLRHLSTYDHNYSGPKDIKTSEQMADYLQPRLLGVIAFFDSQLLNARIPLSDKRLVSGKLLRPFFMSISRGMGVDNAGWYKTS